MATLDKIRINLGAMTKCAAALDNKGSNQSEAYSRLERGKGWVRGTRKDLLEVLYYIEGCPAAWADGQDMTEVSAVKRTIKNWRAKLGLAAHEEYPVPESARR